MYCVNCGQEIPKGVKFCPECGTKVARTDEDEAESAAYTTGTLTVLRKKASLASAAKTKVYVDGEQKGSVGEGRYISIELKTGVHTVELKTSGDKSVTQTVTIHENRETALHFTMAVFAEGKHKILEITESPAQVRYAVPSGARSVQQQAARSARTYRRCPKCGGPMNVQTVSESRKTGCFTIFLYVLLALTIFGLLIVIPLALRKKTETVTYAVCQRCGHKQQLSRQ